MKFAKAAKLATGIAILTGVALGGVVQAGATSPTVTLLLHWNCTMDTDVCEPSGIAVDPTGTIWVGDSANQVLNKVAADGSSTSDVVDATNLLRIGRIEGVASKGGYIYFSDTGTNEIWRIPDSSTTAASTTPELVSQSPALNDASVTLGVAVDGVGNVFWGDGQSPGHVYEHVAGTATSSYVTFGTGLDAPTQIAFGPDGKIYTADSGDSSVMVLPVDGGTATTYASDPSTTGSKLTGLAFAPDGSGNLYVIDGAQFSVVGVSEVARTTAGTAGAISVVVPNTWNANSLPAGIAFGSTSLLIADIASGIWSATIPDMAPGQPLHLAAKTDVTSATLTWNPPLFVGSGLTSYTVSVQPGGASCTVTAPTTTCTISGLDPSTHYTFSITATGPGGTSVPTSITASTAAAPVVPAAAAPVVPAATLASTGLNAPVLVGAGMGLMALGFVVVPRRRRIER